VGEAWAVCRVDVEMAGGAEVMREMAVQGLAVAVAVEGAHPVVASCERWRGRRDQPTTPETATTDAQWARLV